MLKAKTWRQRTARRRPDPVRLAEWGKAVREIVDQSVNERVSESASGENEVAYNKERDEGNEDGPTKADEPAENRRQLPPSDRE